MRHESEVNDWMCEMGRMEASTVEGIKGGWRGSIFD